MEAAKDQSTNAIGGSLLRYPLRSATKSKDSKIGTEDPNFTPATRRLRTTLNLAKSMDSLNLSGKDRSLKHPGRLPILPKPANSPHSITSGNLTPISEHQMDRLNIPMNSDTPKSDSSKSSHRRKFCILASVSYWLGQIKLSESVSKHNISLGFFKLALESGVEPLDRIREELKSYVQRHKLLEEFGNTTKDILDSYDILEGLEKLQISESHSQLAEDITQNTDKVAMNSARVPRTRNLKPKFSSIHTLVESNKRMTLQTETGATMKASNLGNVKNAVLPNGSVGNKTVETSQQTKRRQTTKAHVRKIKCTENNSGSAEVDDLPNEEPKLPDKENMASKNSAIYNLEEVNQAT